MLIFVAEPRHRRCQRTDMMWITEALTAHELVVPCVAGGACPAVGCRAVGGDGVKAGGRAGLAGHLTLPKPVRSGQL